MHDSGSLARTDLQDLHQSPHCCFHFLVVSELQCYAFPFSSVAKSKSSLTASYRVIRSLRAWLSIWLLRNVSHSTQHYSVRRGPIYAAEERSSSYRLTSRRKTAVKPIDASTLTALVAVIQGRCRRAMRLLTNQRSDVPPQLEEYLACLQFSSIGPICVPKSQGEPQ